MDQVGALQGAAETVRTIASVIGSPLITGFLAQSIRSSAHPPGMALLVAAAFSLAGFSLFSSFQYF